MEVNKEDLPETIAEKIEDETVEFEMTAEAVELFEENQRLRKEAREQRASRLLKKTEEELKHLTNLIEQREKGTLDVKAFRKKAKKAQRWHKSSLFEVKMMDRRTDNGV